MVQAVRQRFARRQRCGGWGVFTPALLKLLTMEGYNETRFAALRAAFHVTLQEALELLAHVLATNTEADAVTVTTETADGRGAGDGDALTDDTPVSVLAQRERGANVAARTGGQRLWGEPGVAGENAPERMCEGTDNELLANASANNAENDAVGATMEAAERHDACESDALADDTPLSVLAQREREAHVAARRQRVSEANELARERRVMATEERAATDREGKERRARALSRERTRAGELLSAELELAAAKASVLAAEAEEAEARVAYRTYAYLPYSGGLHKRMHLAGTALTTARERLQAARVATTLRTNKGWAANGVMRRLAAQRALMGGRLPRELRAGQRAGWRARHWQEPEGARARARRLKDAAAAELHRERALMTGEDGSARERERGARKQAKAAMRMSRRRTRREMTETLLQQRAAAVRALDAGVRRRLEAQAAAEAVARGRRGGAGTGAGRRDEGPATTALRALQKAETTKVLTAVSAAAKAPALPRRTRLNEVLDALNGTRTYDEPRAPNSLGVVQDWLAEDVVAAAWEAQDADEDARLWQCGLWMQDGDAEDEQQHASTRKRRRV